MPIGKIRVIKKYVPKVLILADIQICDSCATPEEASKLTVIEVGDEQSFCDQCESVVIKGRWRRQG